MKKVLPIILTGSLIFFYNVFRSYIPALPDLSPIANFSFGLLAIFVAFFVTHEAMIKLAAAMLPVLEALTADELHY